MDIRKVLKKQRSRVNYSTVEVIQSKIEELEEDKKKHLWEVLRLEYRLKKGNVVEFLDELYVLDDIKYEGDLRCAYIEGREIGNLDGFHKSIPLDLVGLAVKKKSDSLKKFLEERYGEYND